MHVWGFTPCKRHTGIGKRMKEKGAREEGEELLRSLLKVSVFFTEVMQPGASAVLIKFR